jgi:hypothetical protein
VELVQHPFGHRHELAARGGDLHAPRVAGEQRDAEDPLDALDGAVSAGWDVFK